MSVFATNAQSGSWSVLHIVRYALPVLKLRVAQHVLHVLYVMKLRLVSVTVSQSQFLLTNGNFVILQYAKQ